MVTLTKGWITASKLSWGANADKDPKILGMVLRGYCNKDISVTLDVKLSYVKYRLTALYKQHDVRNRAALIAKLRPFDGEFLALTRGA